MKMNTLSNILSMAGDTRNDIGQTIQLRSWTIQSSQYVDVDWHYYSKAWHRSHGPKVSIESRQLTFTRRYGRGTQKKTVFLNSWQGDFLAKSIIELGLDPKKSKYSLKIRLNKAYDAKLIEVKRGYKIYQRTLLGAPADWVIQSPLGMVYHDAERGNLVKGLHNKIRNQSRKLQGLVDWEMCRKLGFCKEGIKSFCDAYGFNTNDSYTPQEIERAVRRDTQKAIPFISELKTLANAINYQTNWN